MFFFFLELYTRCLTENLEFFARGYFKRFIQIPDIPSGLRSEVDLRTETFYPIDFERNESCE